MYDHAAPHLVDIRATDLISHSHSHTIPMSFTRPPAVEAIVSNPAESRDNVVDLLRDLLKPLQGGMSAGHGRIRIGHTGTHFDHRAAEMEGFARALWGLAPLLAVQPDHPDFTRMAGDWVDGLDHGTDPDHEDYWGKPGVRDQRHVELAAIVSLRSSLLQVRCELTLGYWTFARSQVAVGTAQ